MTASGRGGRRLNSGRKPVVVLRGADNVPLGVPTAPRDMAPDAKAIYRRVGREMLAHGLGTRLDGTVLAVHADALARLERYRRQLDEDGPLVRGRDGLPVASPLVKLHRDCEAVVLRTAAELGLTPAARGRVKPSEPTAADSSPIAQLLARRRAERDWWDVGGDDADGASNAS